MGVPGDGYDNTIAASFFPTLQCETLDRVRLQTPAEPRIDVFQLIEGWHDPIVGTLLSTIDLRSNTTGATNSPSNNESPTPSTKLGQLQRCLLALHRNIEGHRKHHD